MSAPKRTTSQVETVEAWLRRHLAKAPPLNDAQGDLITRLIAPHLRKGHRRTHRPGCGMTNPDDEDLAREAVEAAERVDKAALDRATRRRPAPAGRAVTPTRPHKRSRAAATAWPRPA